MQNNLGKRQERQIEAKEAPENRLRIPDKGKSKDTYLKSKELAKKR